jgi:hypothetical protein
MAVASRAAGEMGRVGLTLVLSRLFAMTLAEVSARFAGPSVATTVLRRHPTSVASTKYS